jgi:hypothetical protein
LILPCPESETKPKPCASGAGRIGTRAEFALHPAADKPSKTDNMKTKILFIFKEQRFRALGRSPPRR